eukprot:294678_1
MIITILSISAFIMIICILIHYSQHFRFRSCKEEVILFRKQSTFDKDSIIDRTPHTKTEIMLSRCLQECKLNCCIGVKNNEEFDVFPAAFLIYMIFILIVTGLIILRYITAESNISYTIITPNSSPTNLGNLTILVTSMTKLTLSIYLDWIIYISIFVTTIFESFFSFYRYYTTISSQHFYIPNITAVIKSFLTYTITFTLLFTIQTQLYYPIFPIVFLCYFITNIYWICKLTYVLIESFKKLTSLTNDNCAFKDIQSELIRHVNLVKNISVLCIIISSVYVLAFLIIYNMDIVYYFPIIWAISITCFLFNFIRNRKYVSKCYHSKQELEEKPQTVLNLDTTNSNKEFKINTNFMEGISEGNEIEMKSIEPGAPTNKKFEICVENVDENKKRIDLTNITSHSDDLVLKYNIENNTKLYIKNAPNTGSHSTGDLMSFSNKKTKKFNVSKIFKEIIHLPLINNHELYTTDITQTIEKIQFDIDEKNNNVYIPPNNGKQSPSNDNPDGLIILEESKTKSETNTRIPHETNKYNSKLKLRVTHGISSDNTSQSHLSLNIFDGSTIDTFDDSIDFDDNDAITDLTQYKKPMSTLTLPGTNIINNNVRNNMIGMRSSSNPVLTNVGNDHDAGAGKKHLKIDPKIAMALEHVSSVPVLKSLQSTPDTGHVKSSSVGKSNHRRKRSRHKGIMNNKIIIPKQQLLMMHRNSSAVSVLNLFMKQGFCHKNIISNSVNLSTRNVYK